MGEPSNDDPIMSDRELAAFMRQLKTRVEVLCFVFFIK